MVTQKNNHHQVHGELEQKISVYLEAAADKREKRAHTQLKASTFGRRLTCLYISHSSNV